jgi:hypothetical protein
LWAWLYYDRFSVPNSCAASGIVLAEGGGPAKQDFLLSAVSPSHGRESFPVLPDTTKRPEDHRAENSGSVDQDRAFKRSFSPADASGKPPKRMHSDGRFADVGYRASKCPRCRMVCGQTTLISMLA